jgi:hypothetical protein
LANAELMVVLLSIPFDASHLVRSMHELRRLGYPARAYAWSPGSDLGALWFRPRVTGHSSCCFLRFWQRWPRLLGVGPSCEPGNASLGDAWPQRGPCEASRLLQISDAYRGRNRPRYVARRGRNNARWWSGDDAFAASRTVLAGNHGQWSILSPPPRGLQSSDRSKRVVLMAKGWFSCRAIALPC